VEDAKKRVDARIKKSKAEHAQKMEKATKARRAQKMRKMLLKKNK
jgi:hypothetical protein